MCQMVFIQYSKSPMKKILLLSHFINEKTTAQRRDLAFLRLYGWHLVELDFEHRVWLQAPDLGPP